MAKTKRRYVCQECGSVSHRWQGQCADCAQWNTLVEDVPATVFSQKHDLSSGGRPVMFEPLNAPTQLPVRKSTGMAEFDRALACYAGRERRFGLISEQLAASSDAA